MALKKSRNESGQAVFEYILLLFIVVSAYLAFISTISRFGLGARMMKPIQEDYRRAYQYGHPKAKGPDEGTPENHPRAEGGTNDFRIFINPSYN